MTNYFDLTKSIPYIKKLTELDDITMAMIMTETSIN